MTTGIGNEWDPGDPPEVHKERKQTVSFTVRNSTKGPVTPAPQEQAEGLREALQELISIGKSFHGSIDEQNRRIYDAAMRVAALSRAGEPAPHPLYDCETNDASQGEGEREGLDATAAAKEYSRWNAETTRKLLDLTESLDALVAKWRKKHEESSNPLNTFIFRDCADELEAALRHSEKGESK